MQTLQPYVAQLFLHSDSCCLWTAKSIFRKTISVCIYVYVCIYILILTYIYIYINKLHPPVPYPWFPACTRPRDKHGRNRRPCSSAAFGLVWAHRCKGNGFCGKLDLFLLSLFLSFGCLDLFFCLKPLILTSLDHMTNKETGDSSLFLLHDSYYVVDELPFELWEVNVNVTFDICFLSTLFLHNLDLLISL